MHHDLYKYARHPFGVKTAPASFQHLMDIVTSGLSGTSAYRDEISAIEHSLQKLQERVIDLQFSDSIKIDVAFEVAHVMTLPTSNFATTEFDIELSQTDIRELSRKLLELAGDSNSVQEDIHNTLPEDTTSSCKARDKQKGKTPKPTATKKQKPSQSAAQNRSP
ncbi:unnamed protein product [Hymenolepis diminuta]|uniref:Uncharacterized protein n=1 Tax=Hymenolepis diminuta TaxID=6216 RepID=A0A564Z6H8_HYMDI|nr:unnamed protein product [Hymenolepis diminuta]VUZ55050.1 unnamed protein product [Hymenolepis diminuta]VUZ55052.1 unnamed protein product [Hymenolepis diminuta]